MINSGPSAGDQSGAAARIACQLDSSVPRIAESIRTSAAVFTFVLFVLTSTVHVKDSAYPSRPASGARTYFLVRNFARFSVPCTPDLRGPPGRLFDILHFLASADSRPLAAQRVAVGRIHLTPAAQPRHDFSRLAATRRRASMTGPEISNAVVIVGCFTLGGGFDSLHKRQTYARDSVRRSRSSRKRRVGDELHARDSGMPARA